jgi:hypothetical protein
MLHNDHKISVHFKYLYLYIITITITITITIIIIIIIIIGKTALFEPYPSLEDSARLHPVFHLFGFRNTNFFFLQSKFVSLATTLNLENYVPAFTYPSDRVAQLYPQAPSSLFIAPYDPQGYGGDILICLHTGMYLYMYKKGHVLSSWFRHYATSRKVAGSIPDEVIEFFS